MSDSASEAKQQLLAVLSEINFADQYYALCAKFAKSGPDLPLDEQTALMKETGRSFVHDKREKFFACRDDGPSGHEIGLNVSLRDSAIELVFVLAVPSGQLGGPFSALAQAVKRLRVPDYKHTPPYPRVKYAGRAEATAALGASLEIYDAVKSIVQRQKLS